MSLSTKKVLKYSLLPEFLPRLHSLFTSGFQHIAWAMTSLYYSVRLLPPDHPYLNPANKGRYGIRHVIAEAARNLTFDRKHIDQILIFGILLIGFILLVAQFALLIVAVITQQPAFAAEMPNIAEIFRVNPDIGADQDIAFMLFDHIFGLIGIFESCVSNTAIACQDINGNDLPTPANYPFPSHLALHQLLALYSQGIFIIGVIILLYLVTVIIGETATTGSPFGQRYNKTWVPIRIILFFTLLTPMSGPNAGINLGQRIVFEAAHKGSVFATNGWIYFNKTLSDSYLSNTQSILTMGKGSDLIAKPRIPEVNALVKFMSVVQACQRAEMTMRSKEDTPPEINPYLVRSFQILSFDNQPTPNYMDMTSTTYEAARKYANNGDLIIRFGFPNDDPNKIRQYNLHWNYKGKVKPICGEIIIPANNGNLKASDKINELYYNLLLDMWEDKAIKQAAQCIALPKSKRDAGIDCTKSNQKLSLELITHYHQYLDEKLQKLINQASDDSDDWNIPEQLMKKGWAGAAIWYNRVAAMNGEISSAVFGIPQPAKYPFVMELVANKKRLTTVNLDPKTMFSLETAQGKEIAEDILGDRDIARVLSKTYDFWENDHIYESHFTQQTNNIFLDMVNALLGTTGIFDMYKNTDVNPLAQLSTLGKSLVDTAIRNIGVGIGGGIAVKFFEGAPATLGKTITSFMSSIGFMTLSMGFLIYYVLPFMPFIYFFFAVSGWIKSIFEAIVAVPLWALGHLSRWDGEGIVGPGAQNGYFLIFEIFLRPIMVLFGLIASISLFSATVAILNDIFSVALDGLLGSDQLATSLADDDGIQGLDRRGPIDTFFLTTLYVILCYMLGLACFKLIDAVPEGILRWMGQSVKGFQEDAGDAPDRVMQSTWKGMTLITRQVKSGGTLAFMM